MHGKRLQKATFAGGCFWCMQGPFDHLEGVKSTTVGYTGGNTERPSYEEVSSGKTGHAEAVEILFDPEKVSYRELLEVFWRNIDPTSINRQFADKGNQYRTAIFYHDENQKNAAEETKRELEISGKFDKPIATEITPASDFYPAENYHQEYYLKNPFRYEIYHQGSGRADFIKEIWGKTEKPGEIMEELRKKHCLPREGKVNALKETDENRLREGIINWEIVREGEHKLRKTIKTETFRNTVNLLNKIADIAEEENHHPDLHLYYNKLNIELYTHKAGGLTENDFIMAAKIDELQEKLGFSLK